ncbi:MAG: response regulator transcription factor [Bacteroidales bacterium]|nr:response regulator transcription factor [Candidatus Colimorpha pelethequi]
MNLGIKLLVAEDDPNLGTILNAYLTQKGYSVFLATDGQIALDTYQKEDIDACILDIMMPVKDGYAVAKEIRRVDKKTPILFLSAKNLEADKLKGFEVGADDYITKPFSMDELLARLNANIRRAFDDGKPEKNLFHFSNTTFDYFHRTLTVNGETRTLTTRESDLLRFFAINFNQLVDRNSTLQKIWKDDSFFAARSMDVYITKLRKYLKDDPQLEIVNIHGVGFKLVQKT